MHNTPKTSGRKQLFPLDPCLPTTYNTDVFTITCENKFNTTSEKKLALTQKRFIKRFEDKKSLILTNQCTLFLIFVKEVARGVYLESSRLRSTACWTTLRFLPQSEGSRESRKSASSCSRVVSNTHAFIASLRCFSASS